MKRIILLIFACFCLGSVHAAYLRNVPVTLTQPDGTVLHCYASGDEFFNYLHDANGFTIVQHPQTGFYVYADKRDGQLVATEFVADRVDPASKNLQPFNLISPQEWMERRKAWKDKETLINRDDLPNHGTLNNISIFIRFSDDAEFTNTYSSINNMFNDTSQNAVSMRTYFRAASYGAIEIPTYFYPGHDGETIISYQDTYPRSYFQPYNSSTNTNGYQDDNERQIREFDLLERAVNYINGNDMIPTDLNIDYNDDGYVDNVCFIVRGNVGTWSSLLWPHQWSLYDRTVSINGKRVYTFNFQLADASGYFNTSTMCHEMNHSLSAPDLYHYYNGTNLSPVGSWDLMQSNANPPQHCGAYMKMKYGHWIDEIPEITQAGTYTLNPISSATPTNVAYKIRSEDPNQFYVLEYRDKTSLFESALPGSGLLIYRIDTRFNGNQGYDPSNGIYDEVYIFRPGGSPTVNGNLNNAHFSSDVGRTEFSASTSAYPFFTDGTIDNNFRIYNITNAGSTISFTYGSTSVCDPPTNLVASVDGKDVSLSWDAANNAQSYNIYRNGALVGNTSGTTYLDNYLPYRTYTYYLKSVDADGALSVSSETVSVDVTPLQVVAEYYPEANNPNSPYVKVHWHNSRSIYNVYRCSCDGEEVKLIAENVSGDHYIDYDWPALSPGNYKYGIDIVNGRGKVEEPSRVTDDDGWLYYDNGTYAMSVGTGNTMYWGIMYPSEMLASYSGTLLSKVALYENSNNSSPITLNIYLGGMPAPSTLVYTDTFDPIGASSFHEIALSETVAIDGTQELWIVFSSSDRYPANGCTDTGDANGRWISFDGNSWDDLADLGANYTWMIRGYFEEDPSQLLWSNCIEKPSLGQQSIELQPGWNWWAPMVEMDLGNLETNLGNRGILILSQDEGFARYENSWTGTLNALVLGKMYKIQLTEGEPLMFVMEGSLSSGGTLSINEGYTWFGYTGGEGLSIAEALGDFEPSEGDQIIGQEGSATFSGSAWGGSLTSLVPGKGYVYVSTTQRSKSDTRRVGE